MGIIRSNLYKKEIASLSMLSNILIVIKTYIFDAGYEGEITSVWILSNILIVIYQLISDAGYQGEITSVSTACHQIEVFSKVIRTSVSSFLEGGEEAIKKNLPEFTVSSVVPLLDEQNCFCFYLLPRHRPGDGRYCNPPPRPSVCLSITFSFCTVTRKRIDVFSRNFASTCTISWGCAV